MSWGDYAKLSTVHSSFASVLHDAAYYGGIESIWTYSEHLLLGTGGLISNERLALKYLYFMAGVTDSIATPTLTSTPMHRSSTNTTSGSTTVDKDTELQLTTLHVPMPDITSDGIYIYSCQHYSNHDETVITIKWSKATTRRRRNFKFLILQP